MTKKEKVELIKPALERACALPTTDPVRLREALTRLAMSDPADLWGDAFRYAEARNIKICTLPTLIQMGRMTSLFVMYKKNDDALAINHRQRQYRYRRLESSWREVLSLAPAEVTWKNV